MDLYSGVYVVCSGVCVVSSYVLVCVYLCSGVYVPVGVFLLLCSGVCVACVYVLVCVVCVYVLVCVVSLYACVHACWLQLYIRMYSSQCNTWRMLYSTLSH